MIRFPPRRRTRLLVGLLVLVLAGAGTATALVLTRRPAAPQAIPTAHLGGSSPGSLISAETIKDLAGLKKNVVESARVVYRSTNGRTNATTRVSGTVFVPPGTPPTGGWPVIAIGHSTFGIDTPCAPSLSPVLDGMDTLVARFLAQGFAVALTDYQGLGEKGVHPYLDSRTAGYNMIDSVRALRATFPNVSTTWGAYGGSQGGGAAWAADEQASSYAPDLHLVGAAAISPAADVTPIIDQAVGGTLTQDQGPAFVYLVESLARTFPGINRDDYRRGSVKTNWDVLTSCLPRYTAARNRAILQIKAAEETPVSQDAADRLRFVLRQWALPQDKVTAPLAVIYGGEDTFVDSAWTDGALLRECALGGTVVRQFLPTKGHGEVDPTPAITWLADRFKGAPVANECPAG